MNHRILQNNIISINNEKIVFPKDTVIKSVIELDNLICFFTFPMSSDLNWSNIETHQIWKERCKSNPAELYCYEANGTFKWKFTENNIVGFGKIDLEKLKESDFVTPERYIEYIEKYKGKELLEVFAGNFCYQVDASTGEIYGRSESR